jgi:hypothetical protein
MMNLTFAGAVPVTTVTFTATAPAANAAIGHWDPPAPGRYLIRFVGGIQTAPGGGSFRMVTNISSLNAQYGLIPPFEGFSIVVVTNADLLAFSNVQFFADTAVGAGLVASIDFQAFYLGPV